jgi:hypothetical protein
MLPCITTGPIALNLSCISHDLAIESIGTRPSSQFDSSEIGQSHRSTVVSRRPFVITPKTTALNNVYEIHLVATSELSLRHHMLPTPPSTPTCRQLMSGGVSHVRWKLELSKSVSASTKMGLRGMIIWGDRSGLAPSFRYFSCANVSAC